MTEPITILIVDANRTNLALMDMLVRKLPGCTTLLQTDPAPLLEQGGQLSYDLAIIAAQLPQPDGIDLARRLRGFAQLRDKPVLLAAEEPAPALRMRAREAGIAAVLSKPIDPVELRARIRSLVAPDGGPPPQPGAREPGWDAGEAAAPEISPREEELISLVTRIAGWRDREPPLHSQRVGRYCAIIAHHMGLAEDYCRDIRLAAPLHDVGRIGLAEALRGRTGFLSPEERHEMQEHTRIGHALLCTGRAPVFRMAADIALTHHERWDGSGYPQRLRGEQIPLSGRIAAVADVFDALTSMRAYKTAWALGNAFGYLQENAGVEFDPACVAAFASGSEEVLAVMRAMPDAEGKEADAA